MSLVEDYTFQLDDDGFLLNSDALPDVPFVDIDQIEGLDSGELDVSEHNRAGMDGGFVQALHLTTRTIVIDGTLYSPGNLLERTLDNLKENYEPSEKSRPFYLKAPGVEERVLFVKSLGLKYPWSRDRRTGKTQIQIQLKAEDPVFYGPLKTITIGIGIGVNAGRGYNKAYPYGYNVDIPEDPGEDPGAVPPPPDAEEPSPEEGTIDPGYDDGITPEDPTENVTPEDPAAPTDPEPPPPPEPVYTEPDAGSNDAFNVGNRSTPATIRLYGPAKDPGVIHGPTGRMLRFKMTVADGDFLEVNLRNRTVMLNGLANRRARMTSDSRWFMLQKGHNLMAYVGEPTGLTQPYATVTYRPAYR